MFTPTQRHLAILRFVAVYRTVTRAIIQAELFPDAGKDGAVVRKLLNQLFHEGLLNKTRQLVVNPANGAPAPVYYPSRKGCELLAIELRDDRWLTVCTRCPDWQKLHHWTEIAKFRIAFDKALALQQDVTCDGWLTEWDVANPEADNPADRFSLFLEIRKQPRLVAAPDAGWLLTYRTFRKIYYLELDRATSGIQQIAASKTPGYAEMAKQQLHRRHFPQTNMNAFSVLSVSPTANRRDALRRAIAPKDGAALWRFVSQEDIRPDTLLFESILYTCAEGPLPMVKRLEGGAK